MSSPVKFEDLAPAAGRMLVEVEINDVADRLAPHAPFINAEGRLACNLLRAMIGVGAIELADDGVWRLNPGLGRCSVTGVGSEAHALLDRLKDQGGPWTR